MRVRPADRVLRPLLAALDGLVNTPRRLALAVVVDWAVCSWTYSLLEGKGPIEGLWWGIVTGSTVGYGDFYPDSTAGRGVGAFLIVSMWVLALVAGAHLAAALVRTRDDFTHEEQEVAEALARENNALLRALLADRSGAGRLAEVLDEHRRGERARETHDEENA